MKFTYTRVIGMSTGLTALLAVSAAAPEDYASWEREYVSLKTETGESETRESRARARKGR